LPRSRAAGRREPFAESGIIKRQRGVDACLRQCKASTAKAEAILNHLP
jgi:hypothetical protein